jgi:P27 family predicted phage terminase small subunit
MVQKASHRMATTGRPNGRPAKPVEVKRALGNPGKRPLPDAPTPDTGLKASTSIPTMPVLGADGRLLWQQIWTAGKTWLNPSADSHLITMLCQSHDEAEDIRRAIGIGEVPRFYKLPNGSFVTHPLVVQLKDIRVQSTAWLAAIGFSPADRSRLGLGEVRQSDEFDELNARRANRMRAGA